MARKFAERGTMITYFLASFIDDFLKDWEPSRIMFLVLVEALSEVLTIVCLIALARN